jgi:ribonuclease J
MVEVEKRKNHSEQQVKKMSDKVVASTDNMVFVTHYSRDMDRFHSLYNVAKNNSRKIVIFPKTAYLLTKLMSDKRLALPDPLRDDNILVYYKRKRSGQIKERDYYVWERDFMEKKATHAFVHKHQSKLVMDLNFYQFADLIDIKPNQGSHFIHSMSEPFSEEDIEDEVMHNWIRHFKLQFHQLHASGHLNKHQLTDLINTIKPKKLFPIHTEHPQLFGKFDLNVQRVKYGEKHVL